MGATHRVITIPVQTASRFLKELTRHKSGIDFYFIAL